MVISVIGCLLSLLGCLVAYWAWTKLLRQDSFVFCGLSRAEEREIDETAGVPLSELSGAALRALALMNTFVKTGRTDPRQPGRDLERKHPKCCMGPAMVAAAYAAMGQHDYALDALDRAYELASRYPEVNHVVEELLPSEDELYNRPRESVLTTRVPNLFWTVDGDLELPGTHMHLQSSIVRLSNDDLVLVNPTAFDKNVIIAINALGTVGTLVTSTAPHGEGLKKAALIWPDARILGTDSKGRHDAKQLHFDGFLCDGGDDGRKYFGDELFCFRLRGHVFKEVLMYHRASKALIGLTDTVILNPGKTVSGQEYVGFGMTLYGMAMGLYRGKAHGSKVCGQSYHLLFAYDRASLRSSVEQALALPFEHLTCGHAGYFKGKSARREFTTAFDWLLREDGLHSHSLLRQVALALPYVFSKGIPSLVMTHLLAKRASQQVAAAPEK